jgi:hypothetical protein
MHLDVNQTSLNADEHARGEGLASPIH